MKFSNQIIPVKVEVPCEWMKSKLDGDRNTLMFKVLKESIEHFNLSVSYEDIPFNISFKARTAPKDGFTLSYHSVGNVPHVWRIKETPVQYYYSFERFGFSGWSELSVNSKYHQQCIQEIDCDIANTFTKQLRQKLIETNTSKYQQPDKPFLLEEPFVFYCLQKPRDIVAQLNRLNAIKVLHQAALLAKKKKIMLVVKRHPYCKNPWVTLALQKAVFNNPYVITTSASIHKILPLCSSVLVANSSVGFEALIHGKNVYSFGYSEYELATTSLNSLSDIEKVFLNKCDRSKTRMDCFVYYFLTKYCFNIKKPNDIDIQLQRAINSIKNDTWVEQEKIVIFPKQ